VASVSAQSVLQLTRTQLSDKIDVFSGFANGNVLSIRSDTGTLLIDAQSARRVGLLDSALTALNAPRVRLIINTHYHGDHIEGNAHFRAKGARVLAQENVAKQAAKDTTIESWENWHRVAAVAEAFPTNGFRDSTVVRFGGEELRVYHAPNAHTDGDAIIWLPRSNILHIGDIFELNAEPFIDWWAGGTLAGMITAVDRVLAMIDDRTRVVPGHGPVSDRATLVSYRAMLGTMQTRVQAAIDAGKSLDELLATHPTAEFDERLGGPRHGQRLTRLIYAGLARRSAGN
jgi:glyoxylase-like metal-dependent hydrolase (beta-lactamase superfamily II)